MALSQEELNFVECDTRGRSADDELAELQARVRLDDVSDSWKLLANFVSVHARD